jgi:hypothetical protein
MANRSANLTFPDIAALQPHLVAEVPVWSSSEGGTLTAVVAGENDNSEHR